MRFTHLLFFTACLSAAGCKCGPGTQTNKADFVAMPLALNFSACPTKDETGNPVADVFPDEQKVTIQNQGKAGGTLSVTLSGADMAQFKLDAARTPMDIGASSSAELPVQFSPAKKGDAKATLTIDDGDESTDKITVDLVGTGKNLPSQPSLEAVVESTVQTCTATSQCQPGNECFNGFCASVCKYGSPLFDCQQTYPDTLLGDTVTLKIKLRNKGCPALKITKLTLEKSAGGADDMAFFLDSPSTLPSPQNPMVMSTADGTAEVTLVVRFSPQPDQSMDSQRYADIKIETNDPQQPMYALSLSGSGVSPAIYSVPSFCNFNEAGDPCRPTGAKVANEAVYDITNGGSAAVTITSAKFKSTDSSTSGTGGRFTVMTPIDGTVLQPGGKATLTVKHNDMPLFVIDQIVVTASPASAGKLFLTVAGGTAPCLETNPLQTLDFNAPTMELTTQPVVVKALAMRAGTSTPCGDLIVDGTEIPTNPFFTIVDPKIAPGTKIAAGQQAQINVQYKKPVTGGRQAGDLVIRTNDLDYAGPAYKKLLIQSDAPFNPIPEAIEKACSTAMFNGGVCSAQGTTMMTVSLAAFGTAAKEIKVYGGDSTDATPGMVTKWKFQVTPPMGVTGHMLSGASMFTTSNVQTLTLDPTAIGLYKVYLTVQDDTGQSSGTPAQVSINVHQ